MDGRPPSSKTRAPQARPGLLSRPDLVRRLDGDLVLVSAPAGFGKTTLAGEAFRAAPGAKAWVSLEAADGDPARFWPLLALATAEALSQAAHGTCDGLDAVVATARSPQAPTPDLLAEAFAESLEGLEAPLLLVLDDLHAIPAGPLLSSLGRLLFLRPPRLRLILLSRVDPALPLARLRAQGLLSELRAEDLRFSAPDIREVLQREAGLSLGEDALGDVAARTEGWIAGIQLAAITLRRRPDPEAFLRAFRGSDRLVLEFLTEEVLDRQAPEVGEFLLRSAVLPRFCVPEAEALFPPPGGAGAMVDRLLRDNLFLVPLDEEGLWFRYHHLFAESLKARLRRLDPGAEAALLAAAGAWEEGQGRDEAALNLYLGAGQKAEAARVLVRLDYVSSGELATLLGHYRSLGEEFLLTRGRLMDGYAWAQVLAGGVAEALAWMPRALAAAEGLAPAEAEYVRGSFAAMRAFLLALRGRNREALAEASFARPRLGPDAPYPASILPFVVGSEARARMDFPAAEAAFQDLRDHGAAMGASWTQAVGLYEFCATLLLRGETGRLEDLLEEALPPGKARGGLQFAWASRLVAQKAALLLDRGQVREALDLAEPAYQEGRARGLTTSLAELGATLANSLLELGREEDAKLVLAEVTSVLGGQALMPRLAVPLAILAERLAPEEAGIVGVSMPADPAWAEDEALAALRGLAALPRLRAEGRNREAKDEAARLADLGGKAAWPRLSAGALGEGARALAALGQGDGAQALATEARRVGAAAGLTALVRGLDRDFPVREDSGQLPPPPAKAQGLVSPREAEVLNLLAQGLGNRALAEALFVSEATIKTHLLHLATKLEAPNRTAIVARARSLGLLD